VITGSQPAGLLAGPAGMNLRSSSGPGTGEAEPESTRHPRSGEKIFRTQYRKTGMITSSLNYLKKENDNFL
jgi:hypothetical protein